MKKNRDENQLFHTLYRYKSAVDHAFGPRSSQTKDYKIKCYMHIVLMNKGKDWLAQSLNNVPSGATCVYVHCSPNELALLIIMSIHLTET